MIKLRNITNQAQNPDVADTSQTSVKSVFHLQDAHKSDSCDTSDTCSVTCQPPSIFQNHTINKQNDLLLSCRTPDHMVPHTDTLHDNVLASREQLQGTCNSFTLSKCSFKFGNLQMFCYYSDAKPSTGIWKTIPRLLEKDFITSILNLKINITGSRQKYVSQLFKYL